MLGTVDGCEASRRDGESPAKRSCVADPHSANLTGSQEETRHEQ